MLLQIFSRHLPPTIFGCRLSGRWQMITYKASKFCRLPSNPLSAGRKKTLKKIAVQLVLAARCKFFYNSNFFHRQPT